MIRVFEPQLSMSDKISVLKTLFNNNISGTSPSVGEFEKELAKRFDRKHSIAVSNGSVALDLALQNLELKEGDEVIVPTFTIISCLSAILRTKATPVFSDIDIDSWNMTLESVKNKYTEKTKAVMMVHLYGLAAEANAIQKFCKEKNILLIEDAAESHGQVEGEKKCGSFGHISTMSFYANKHITTGEGGALLTNSDSVLEKTRLMRNLDFVNSKRFVHENTYWNYRMSGLQAALGLSQIKSLEKTISNKIQQGLYYQKLLEKYQNLLSTQLNNWNGMQNHYWVFGVLLKKEGIRDQVMKDLLEKDIETRPFFWPLHLQPSLPSKFQIKNDNLNVSNTLGRNGLYIPIGKHITRKKQELIIKNLINSIEKYG